MKTIITNGTIITGGETFAGNVVLDGTPCDVFSQEEIIEAAGLELPESAKLANALRRAGIKLDKNVLTPEDFVEQFKKILY